MQPSLSPYDGVLSKSQILPALFVSEPSIVGGAGYIRGLRLPFGSTRPVARPPSRGLVGGLCEVV